MSSRKRIVFFVLTIIGFMLAVSFYPFGFFSLSTHRYSLNVDSHPGWPWLIDGRQASNLMLTTFDEKQDRFSLGFWFFC